jgi:hypothetical protein
MKLDPDKFCLEFSSETSHSSDFEPKSKKVRKMNNSRSLRHNLDFSDKSDDQFSVSSPSEHSLDLKFDKPR